MEGSRRPHLLPQLEVRRSLSSITAFRIRRVLNLKQRLPLLQAYRRGILPSALWCAGDIALRICLCCDHTSWANICTPDVLRWQE